MRVDSRHFVAALLIASSCTSAPLQPRTAARTTSPRQSAGERTSASGLDLGVSFSDPQAAGDGTDDDPAGALESGPANPPEKVDPFPVHGYFSAGFRGRWASGASDGDLFTFLSIDGGDALKNPVTFHLTARASQDMSGGKEPGDLFFEISDTFSNGLNARLYRAYVDVHSIDALDFLRAGRQQDIETPVPAFYDGLHARSQTYTDWRVQGGAYGGFSTHLFESTNEDDRVFGAYVGAQPWKNGRVRADWMRARDHRRTDGDAQDMYSLTLWQTVMRSLDFEAFYSRLDGEDRDLRLTGNWIEPLHDVQVRASFYQLLERQTTNALEFDPFTSSLFDYEPYYLVSLSGSKGFGNRYRTTLGADLRRLEDSGDEGRFNRDFDRYFLTFSLLQFLQEAGSLNLTTDYWDGGGREYSTLGVDFAGEVNDSLRGSLGTFFSMYKINDLTFEEREDVRTYFLRFDYDLTKALRLAFNYQFEDAEIADFNVLRLDARWSF